MRAPSSVPSDSLPRRPWRALALLLLLLVALWLTRTSLAGYLTEGVLASRGLGPAQVEVIDLTLHHAALALRASALGSIQRLDVDYRFTPALRIEHVRVSGARLQLAWRDGQLSPPLAASDSSAPGPALAVELVDTHVALQLATTRLDLELDGHLTSGARPDAQLRLAFQTAQGQGRGTLTASSAADGALAGRLAMTSLSVAGHSFGAGSIELTQTAPRTSRLAVAFAPLSLEARMAQTDAQARRRFSLNGTLDAHAFAALLPAFSIASGSVSVRATGDVSPQASSLAAALRDGNAQATLRIEAAKIEQQKVLTLDKLTATLDCKLAAAALRCDGARAVDLSGLELASALVAKDSPLAGPSTLQLDAGESAPLLKLKFLGDGGELEFHSRLSLRTARMSVQAPLHARLSLAARAADGASALRGGRFALAGAVKLEHGDGQPWFAPRFKFNGDYTLDTRQPALLSATLTDGQLELPQQAWIATGLAARYDAAATDTLRLTIGELRSTAQPPLLAPLKAEFKARVARDAARVSGKVADGSGQLDIALELNHDRRDGHGEARLIMRPIVLAGADSVRALAPALAGELRDASGKLELSAGAQWGAGPLRSQLALRLDQLALALPAFKLAALDAKVELDSLAPLHSVSGQSLRATLELPALRQVPLDLRFAVDGNTLTLEHARAEVFNGAFEVKDGAIDIASGASRIEVQVVDVDLGAVFTVLNLEQMKGSGRVSGRLPLRFENGHIAIDQGQMQASGAGVVQLGASALTEQLKAHGEDVELAFRALSDFHYQSLAISADKPLLGAGKALFHLQGNNPAVMDGQPFNFNISLETDFDYLAALLLQLSGITNSALGWGAGEMLKPARRR